MKMFLSSRSRRGDRMWWQSCTIWWNLMCSKRWLQRSWNDVVPSRRRSQGSSCMFRPRPMSRPRIPTSKISTTSRPSIWISRRRSCNWIRWRMMWWWTSRLRRGSGRSGTKCSWTASISSRSVWGRPTKPWRREVMPSWSWLIPWTHSVRGWAFRCDPRTNHGSRWANLVEERRHYPRYPWYLRCTTSDPLRCTSLMKWMLLSITVTCRSWAIMSRNAPRTHNSLSSPWGTTCSSWPISWSVSTKRSIRRNVFPFNQLWWCWRCYTTEMRMVRIRST